MAESFVVLDKPAGTSVSNLSINYSILLIWLKRNCDSGEWKYCRNRGCIANLVEILFTQNQPPASAFYPKQTKTS